MTTALSDGWWCLENINLIIVASVVVLQSGPCRGKQWQWQSGQVSQWQ